MVDYRGDKSIGWVILGVCSKCEAREGDVGPRSD